MSGFLLLLCFIFLNLNIIKIEIFFKPNLYDIVFNRDDILEAPY